MFGIKLHPDYQGVHFDDDRYINIMKKAFERGLYVITHAGLDVGYPDHIHCTPDMILNALSKLGSLAENKLILAHLGGFQLYDEVLEKLIGLPIIPKSQGKSSSATALIKFCSRQIHRGQTRRSL